MELLNYLFTFVCGVVTGAVVIGAMAGRSYEKGVKDHIRYYDKDLNLPPDVKRYLDDIYKDNKQ